jgi:cytosine deaminase
MRHREGHLATTSGANTLPHLDTVFERAKLSDGRIVDMGVADGRIASLHPAGALAAPAAHRIDLEGRLVVPGLVEGHIHLDKSFVGDDWKPHIPCKEGFDVLERIAYEKQILAAAAPIYGRASALLEQAVSFGTTHVRSHVDIDASVGLRNLETILALREAYEGLVSIEIVAFPQSGILVNPGTAELLEEAVAAGADVIGGLDPASLDRNIGAHLDVVFGIAERHDVPVDIHLHDAHMLGIFELERISERTLSLGMQGRVAVSHAYCLGDVPEAVAGRTGDLLAKAGVAIMTNAPGNRAFPPVSLLAKAGVVVFAGNDNVRDAWWPYGDADMLGRSSMIGYRSGFFTDAELESAFDLAAGNAARAMLIRDYGLDVGCHADFVALDARHVPEAVSRPPRKRCVYKRGKLVATDGQFIKGGISFRLDRKGGSQFCAPPAGAEATLPARRPGPPGPDRPR